MTDREKPEAKRDFVKLGEVIFKFEGDKIRIATAPRDWITVNLVLGEYQRRFVEAWKSGELDVGEIIIKRDHIIVSFKKGVEFKDTEAVMTIDVNEKNLHTRFSGMGRSLKQ